MAEDSANAEQKKEIAAPAATPVAPKTFKVYGREFDISTDDGFKQAQTWSEAMSTLVGKQSNEIGDLRKEVEPIRKYNLKNASVDEVNLRRQVAELREQGNHLDADNLLFEFGRQSRIAASVELERERMWSDYRESRKDIFEVLPEDMAKNYVFSGYSSELEKAEDPFSLMDRILQPKASKLKRTAPPSVSSEPPPAVLGTAPPPSTKSAEPAVKEPTPMEKVLADFGFKSM